MVRHRIGYSPASARKAFSGTESHILFLALRDAHDAFEISYFRSFADDVGLEEQAVVLDPNPDTLFSIRRAVIAETA
jgi:hypothetical protein